MRLTKVNLTTTLTAALLLAGDLSGQAPAPAQARVLALVGGTLIDGHGGPPIRNSVIIVEGDPRGARRRVALHQSAAAR